jgi:dihydrofolate reductase
VSKLVYSALSSLDGYIEDAEGRFDWATPDDEVHAFVNELERPIATHLYGRRMYETMAYWESPANTADQSAAIQEYGEIWRAAQEYGEIWRAADKVVYSRTLETVSSARTRIEREFDPAAVRRLKETTSGDLSIGGPALAAHAIEAGLVDEYHLFLAPVVVGAGKRALPDVRLNLELLDERRFANGTVYLRYSASR